MLPLIKDYNHGGITVECGMEECHYRNSSQEAHDPPVITGCLVTKARRVLRLRMEKTAPRYRG
jgi:hypothetical protein